MEMSYAFQDRAADVKERETPVFKLCATERRECSTSQPPICLPGVPIGVQPQLSFCRATQTAAGVVICKSYNVGNCTRGEECKFTAPFGIPTVAVPTQLGHACFTQLSDLQRAHSHYNADNLGELELATHPENALVIWLLDALDNGATLNFTGPRSLQVSPNLTSAHHHSVVVDNELAPEISAGVWLLYSNNWTHSPQMHEVCEYHPAGLCQAWCSICKGKAGGLEAQPLPSWSLSWSQ